MADLWTFFTEPGRLGAVLGLFIGCCLLRDIGRVVLSILAGARRTREGAGRQHA